MTEQNVAGLNPGVEVDFEENVNPVCGTEEGQLGAAQRLRISVPNVYTQLTLGQSLADDDAQGFAYAGFGVETDGHVFIDAHGGTSKSAVKIQANGPIMVQTDSSNMSLSAAGNNMLHAGGVAMIAGDTDVCIAGGIKHGNDTNYPSDGGTPLPPDWINGVATTVSEVHSWWSNVDTFAAVVEAGILAVDTALAKKDGVLTKEMLIRGFISGFLGSWGGGFNPAANMMEDWAGSSAGSTIVYGKGGLVLGSGRSAGLFSAIGTTVGSMTCAGMIAPWTGVTGLESLELRSVLGDAGLVAGKEIEIIAKKRVTLSSRNEDVHVLGQAIFVGGPAAEDGTTQKKSNKVELNADSVVVNADEHSVWIDKSYVVDSKDLSLGCGGLMNLATGGEMQLIAPKMEIRAIDEVSLHVPGGMGLQMKKSEMFIGVNTATPNFDAKAAGKGKRGKEKSRAVKEAKAEWRAKVEKMTAGDVGIKFKKSKITLTAQGFDLALDSSKLKVASALVCKK